MRNACHYVVLRFLLWLFRLKRGKWQWGNSCCSSNPMLRPRAGVVFRSRWLWSALGSWRHLPAWRGVLRQAIARSGLLSVTKNQGRSRSQPVYDRWAISALAACGSIVGWSQLNPLTSSISRSGRNQHICRHFPFIYESRKSSPRVNTRLLAYTREWGLIRVIGRLTLAINLRTWRGTEISEFRGVMKNDVLKSLHRRHAHPL